MQDLFSKRGINMCSVTNNWLYMIAIELWDD